MTIFYERVIDMKTIRTGNILSNGQPEIIKISDDNSIKESNSDKFQVIISILEKLKNDHNYKELLNKLFKWFVLLIIYVI